jgi:predicted metal-dependent phosphoesterase TrpH
MNVDLHCHSTISDGTLAPAALVRRAAEHGVDALALTDHDRLDGLAEAHEAARETHIRVIDGVEISAGWRGQSVHVLGLGVDPRGPDLAAGLEAVRTGRAERARRMAEGLAAAGIRDCLEGALQYASSPDSVSRRHFARDLAARGVVAEPKAAFRRYLAPGKPGYVPHQWVELGHAVRWILAAGGHAVLAHPARYGLSAGALHALLAEFRAAGGQGIEVVTGSHSAEERNRFGALALHYGLAATRGSDFHGPGERAELGALPELSSGLRPLWRDLPL